MLSSRCFFIEIIDVFFDLLNSFLKKLAVARYFKAVKVVEFQSSLDILTYFAGGMYMAGQPGMMVGMVPSMMATAQVSTVC